MPLVLASILEVGCQSSEILPQAAFHHTLYASCNGKIQEKERKKTHTFFCMIIDSKL